MSVLVAFACASFLAALLSDQLAGPQRAQTMVLCCVVLYEAIAAL